MTTESAFSSHVGLPAHAITSIRKVLATCPAIERAVVYGSRARGTAHAGSDIDIALTGNTLTWEHQATLLDALDNLLLPWKIDLCRINAVDDDKLLASIQHDGVLLYEAPPHT